MSNTRLTDMEFDEISLVDNPAHPDAKVVLFKRHIEDPGSEVDKALHPGTSHNSGPTSSDVHVDRISSHNKPKKKKRRKRKERDAEMEEAFSKHRAVHNELTHGNRKNKMSVLDRALARSDRGAARAARDRARKKELAQEGRLEEGDAAQIAQESSNKVSGGERVSVQRDVRTQPGPRRKGTRSGSSEADFERLEALIRAQMSGRSEVLIQRRIARMRRAEAGKGGGGIVAVRARSRTRTITTTRVKKEVEPMDELYEAVHKFDDEEMRKGLVTAGAPMLNLNNLWEYAQGGEKPNTGVSSGGETTDGGKEAGSRGHSSPRSDGSTTSASVVPSRLNETMAVGNPGTASHDLIREGRAGRQGDPKTGTVSTQELMNQWGLSKVYQEANGTGGGG